MQIKLEKELVEKARQGDMKAVELVCVLMLPLANRVIGVWSSKFPQKADDIKSTGYYALVKAINKCPEGNIVGYAKTCMEGAIRNFLKEDNLIHTPRSHQDAARKADEQWTLPDVLSMDAEDWVETGTQQQADMYGFYEYCLSRIAMNAIESRVLALARGGMTSTAIADRIGLSNTIVCKARRNIYERFNMLRNDETIKKRYFG